MEAGTDEESWKGFSDDETPGNDQDNDLETTEVGVEDDQEVDDAGSDSSEDLPVELTETASKHVTNFRYEEHVDGNVYLHVCGPKDSQSRRTNSLRVPQLVLKPGRLTVDEQDAVKFHEVTDKTCYWKNGEEVHFASRYLNEVETQPCHADMKRLQDLIIDHPSLRNCLRKRRAVA